MVHGKKYWFLVCVDDYCTFLVMAEQFSHEPKTKEVIALLEKAEEAAKDRTV